MRAFLKNALVPPTPILLILLFTCCVINGKRARGLVNFELVGYLYTHYLIAG